MTVSLANAGQENLIRTDTYMLSLVFSANLDASTISSETIKVTDSGGEPLNNYTVGVYPQGSNHVLIYFGDKFSYASVYSIIISPDIKSSAGDTIATQETMKTKGAWS